MNQCEYDLIVEDDPAYIREIYFIKLYFNKHYCLRMQISEQQYNDILEEEKQNENQ